MNRQTVLELLHKYIKNENIRRHCLATEAVMRHLAQYFGKDADMWGITGLLHDLDLEIVNGDMNKHGLETARILEDVGANPEIIEAIKAHNEQIYGVERKELLHHALVSAETVTGLIVATALILPERKLSVVRPESVVKRMKEKSFARTVSRERIKECEKMGISLNDFIVLAVKAMQEISPQLGL